MNGQALELPARPEGAAWPGARASAFWAAAGFLLTLWIPLLSASPYADISGWYTDHLHHSFATWIFLHRGLALYTHPFRDLWNQPGWPFPLQKWGDMPMAYPPGVFAVFLPLVALGKLVPLSAHGFALVCVLYLSALAQLSFYAVMRALGSLQPGLRGAVAVLLWLQLAHLGLQGFYDALYVGCGALALWRLAQKDEPAALRWLAAAALLHFRAVVLLPIGLVALGRIWRGRPSRLLPWPTLGLTAAALLVSGAAFALMYPVTAQVRAAQSPLAPPGEMLALALAGALVGWLWADPAVAAMALLGTALAAVDPQPNWWHGALVWLVPLAVGAASPARHPALARAGLSLWAAGTALLAWTGRVNQLFVEFSRSFHR